MANTSPAEADDGFNDSFSIPLFKEISPKEEKEQGGFKAQYTADDGGLVYCSPKESSYIASVERLLALDGWEDESKQQRMTLLVFQYEVKTTDTNNRFGSVKTWIVLEDPESTKKGRRAIPDVQAWAPFDQTEIWNETEDAVTTEKHIGAEFGANAAGAEGKGSFDVTKTRETKERFFDKGSTTKRYSRIDKRRNGIEWYLTQNKSVNEGVAHKFNLAILFNRELDTPFEITFGLRCKAGLGRTMMGWFGQGNDFDENMTYKPIPDKPRWRYEEGKELLGMVTPDKLGDLYKKDSQGRVQLLKLTSVESLRPLKDPK